MTPYGGRRQVVPSSPYSSAPGAQFPAEQLLAGERRPLVRPQVAADGVPAGDDLLDEVEVQLGVRPHGEEGGARPVTVKDVEGRPRPAGARPVVEGQIEPWRARLAGGPRRIVRAGRPRGAAT